MKLIALAAALAITAPAIAQTGTTPSGAQPAQTGSTNMQSSQAPAPDDPATSPAPSPDTGMSTPAGSSATTAAPASQAAPASTSGMTATASGEDPAGGYMPQGPALQGSPQPGAKIVVQASQSPDQAFPAPAPLAKYPVCKRGQFDNCRQRGG